MPPLAPQKGILHWGGAMRAPRPRCLCCLALAALAASAPVAKDVALRPADISISTELRANEGSCPVGCVEAPAGDVVVTVDTPAAESYSRALKASSRGETNFLAANVDLEILKTNMATLAGVPASQVQVQSSGSNPVRITFLIDPSPGTAADMSSQLSTALASPEAATAALGVTVLEVPDVEVAGSSPTVHGDPMFKINGTGTHFCAPLAELTMAAKPRDP